MSHTVEIKAECRSKGTIAAACRALGLESPQEGVHQLYGGKFQGVAIKLPGWRYPVVFDTKTGTARMDNYNGAWGPAKELDKFLTRYQAEQIKATARRKGHSFREVVVSDTEINVEVTLGE